MNTVLFKKLFIVKLLERQRVADTYTERRLSTFWFILQVPTTAGVESDRREKSRTQLAAPHG